MSKRPSQLDRAIQVLDRDLAELEQQAKALTLARQRLVEQRDREAGRRSTAPAVPAGSNK